jgi:hypothetical protein
MIPQRIQRKRVKGYKQPPNTRYCGRGTKFGNPFILTDDGWVMYKNINKNISNPWIYWSITGGFNKTDIVELYKIWIKGGLSDCKLLPSPPNLSELKNYDYLSCFCPLDQPCHVDVLIKLLKK